MKIMTYEIEFKPKSIKDIRKIPKPEQENILKKIEIMISVHPSILEKDGIKEFAVLPYNEFLKIREELEDYEDLKLLRQAKLEEADSPSISLRKAKAIFKVKNANKANSANR